MSYNQVVIDKKALRHNFRKMQDASGGDVRIMAIVKADAYGHGLLDVAKVLQEIGCVSFGVADIADAVLMRNAGVLGDILVFLPHFKRLDLIIKYELQPLVYDRSQIEQLSNQAEVSNCKIGINLKIDCGMGRLGIMPDEVKDMEQLIENLPGVYLASIVGHFPCSDIKSSRSSMDVFDKFNSICQSINKSTDFVRHIANSGGVLNFPETKSNIVRLGISLYGYYPWGATTLNSDTINLKPVMSFKTNIVQVKNIPKGYGISYGHKYITPQDSVFAVVPVGYSNGFSRLLSGKAYVLVKGCRVPVRGTVSMNIIMIDITELKDVHVGDEVVIMGKQGDEEITADEIAHWMGTISYEVLCLFGANNKRIYT